MPVGMIPAGERPENFFFSSIHYAFFAGQRVRSFPRPWWIISSRIVEISGCSGIRTTGRRFAKDAMIRKREKGFS